MSVMARCKYRVWEVRDHQRQHTEEDAERVKAGGKFESTGPVTEQHIKLHTEYDPDDPEDTKFSTATPSGDMNFYLSNPRLIGKFKPGDTFYVDLTRVPAGG